MPAMPRSSVNWTRRYTAVRLGFPAWTEAFPGRVAFVSTESGIWQVWTAEATGERRVRLSDETVGVEAVLVAPDGRIVWWRDATGDERGTWVGVDPEGGTPAALVEGIPAGWSTGISFSGDLVAIGVATGEEYRVYLATGDGPPRILTRSQQPLGVGRLDVPGSGGLSADGRLLCVRESEHGDIVHQALRVVSTDDGATAGELEDAGSHLDPVGWSPVPGDRRLAFTSELADFERPAIWDLATGIRRDLEVDLAGAVIPLGWWPDGSAILARQEHEGRDRLVRVNAETGATEIVADTGGEIIEAAVRPDGEIWLATSDTERPQHTVTSGGRVVLAPPGEPAPTGRPYAPFWFDNPHGQAIQAFVVTPVGTGPFPTVISVHGGPEWHERNRYDPEAQSLVDAGYAVALVNYRGSTGYGVAFRRALYGDPWLPETEDVIACLDALIAAGITDPDRAAFSGWSWGGCLACLTEGLHPDRWKAVVAGIPSGDFVAAHHASMPEIKAYDLALYGGTPEEKPELWAERNPMTFAARAKAPVLVIAGESDPRCPLEGILPWVEAVRAAGADAQLIRYAAGHHANATDQQVAHMAGILDFLARHL
ncbi:MAG: prolyl oligopeptidase family serine peptidase [Actinomycetota bacterium]